MEVRKIAKHGKTTGRASLVILSATLYLTKILMNRQIQGHICKLKHMVHSIKHLIL